MTPTPPQHCDHECNGQVCEFYKGYHPIPCPAQLCPYNTRSNPTPSPRPPCEECIYQSQSAEHDATIRNATLDELLDRMADIDAWGEKKEGYLINDDDVKSLVHKMKAESLRTNQEPHP